MTISTGAGAWLTVGVGAVVALAMAPTTAVGVPAASDDPGKDPDTLGNILSDVSAARASDAWAVGATSPSSGRYLTLARHWDGTRWTTVPTPNPGDPQESVNVLNAVADIAPADAWAVGYYRTGTLHSDSLILHWDGNAWTQFRSASPGPDVSVFLEVDAISPDNAYTLGYSCTAGRPKATLPMGEVPRDCTPLVEHWNGTRWSMVSRHLADTSSVDGLSDSDVYAAGTHVTGTYPHLRYRTEVAQFDGKRWIEMAVPNPGRHGSQLTRIIETAPNDVWAIGTRMWAQGDHGVDSLVMLHWDGDVWSVVRGGALRSVGYCDDLSGSGPDDVWSVCTGSPGSRLVHWDGSAWQRTSYPSGKGYADRVDAQSTTDAWAVGGSYLQGQFTRTLLHWDGSVWTRYQRRS